MQPVKYAIISAAGLGSRLEMNMPKCLVEIGGRKIIDHQLDLLADVENVRIIVGFMEDEVIRHVRAIRDDIVFVRNPDYRKTSNSYSLYLATRDLNEAFITMDGDLLVDQAGFAAFLAACRPDRSLIGITESKTEEAVFVELDAAGQNITGFQRQPRTPWEWCGIACLSGVSIDPQEGYIFKILERRLPLPAHRIKCFEVDTPDDLSYALLHFQPD